MRDRIELNLSEYPNELGKVLFDRLVIEEQISKYKLQYKNIYIDRIENGIELPKFAECIWNHIIKYQKIPTQSDFYLEYVKNNKNKIDKLNLNNEEKDGLKYRMYRSYASFVRDCILSLELKEELSKEEVEVRYNLNLDLKGIDIVLVYRERIYGLRCYVDTKRSKYYKLLKSDRNPNWENIQYIDMPCPIGGRRHKGEVWLYGDRDIDNIKKEIFPDHVGMPVYEPSFVMTEGFTVDNF